MHAKKKRILVVEDDAAIARGLEDVLRSENFAVTTCSDGKVGLAKVFSFSPDLILLDVNLPGIGGYEVCRELRAKGFPNPIIMLTSRSEQIDKVVGLEAGADDYVTKPFNIHEILARVRAHIRCMDRLSHLPAAAAVGGKEKYRHRLLSIMFTDMKDYSKKMNEDEKLALALLKTHNDMVTRAVSEYGGKVVENIGDAFLASFESAVKAVQCAVAIQQDFRAYRRTKLKKEQIQVRIGIHLGEVIEVDGKLKGDTINLAARVQQIAEPDCVYISETLFNTIKNKIDLRVRDLGEHSMKNIKQPIKVYEVKV